MNISKRKWFHSHQYIRARANVEDHEKATAWTRDINGTRYLFLAIICVKSGFAKQLGLGTVTLTENPRICVFRYYGKGKGSAYGLIKEFPIVRTSKVSYRMFGIGKHR